MDDGNAETAGMEMEEEVEVKIEPGEMFLAEGTEDDDETALESSDLACPVPFHSGFEIKGPKSELEKSRQRELKRDRELARLKIEPAPEPRSSSSSEDEEDSDSDSLQEKAKKQKLKVKAPKRKAKKTKVFTPHQKAERKCTHCSQRFKKIIELKNHINKKHSGEPGLSCRVEGCSEKFFYPGARTHHEVKVHRVGGKVYKCPQCPEWSGLTGTELNQHSARVHPTEEDLMKRARWAAYMANKRKAEKESGNEPSFQCGSCAKTFTRAYHLNKHMTVHTGERPFACTEPDCDRSFSQKCNLELHVRSDHKGHKPFQCEFCDKSLATKGQLNFHIKRLHSAPEDKEFPCQHCDMRFVMKSRLEQHLLKHTGEKKFICEKCGQGFTSNGSMVNHIIFKHRYDEDVQEKYWRQD